MLSSCIAIQHIVVIGILRAVAIENSLSKLHHCAQQLLLLSILLLDKIQLSDLTNNPHCFLSLAVIDAAAATAVYGSNGVSVRRTAASTSRVISNDKINNGTNKFRQTDVLIQM